MDGMAARASVSDMADRLAPVSDALPAVPPATPERLPDFS